MDNIEKVKNHPDVKQVVALLKSNTPLQSIASSKIQKAADLISHSLTFVINERGIADVNEKAEIPIPHNIAIRSLILLRCLYRYQYENDTQNQKRYVDYEGKRYAVPSQQMLCDSKKSHVGLISDMYTELQIGQIGFPSELACGGSPHIRDAAAILSYAGLLVSRGYMQNVSEENDNNDDQEIPSTNKQKTNRTPFILTEEGLILSYWLFGDIPYIVNRNLHGYTGIPVIAQSKSGKYCGWFDYLKIDSDLLGTNN